tara:strand:- start:306 stop:2666 length:2361 start_codon:yes stop_codon:yes gene_type:complete
MATNTTATATTHTGNGSTNNFAISFSFLANNEVDVTVAGVLKTLDTHYTISGSTVTFTSGNTPANGAAVKFQRDTNISAKKVDFQDGSVLTETDLDSSTDQLLFSLQELADDYVKRDGSQTVIGNLVFEGSTDDNNETTLAITNPTADRTITLPDTTGTVVTTGDSGTVTSTMINDGTIVNADINASAAIDGTKISPNFGSQNIVTSGTVDGRDVSTDGTKLDGIESGATADQTAAEIKTLVGNATDSNVFTDADHSKLDGIEASATADQTAAEIRTLVENASDSNVFTDTDHSKLNGIESGATQDQTGAEIKSAYEAESNTNAFTDTEKSKLAAIEASADVTDATNVNAAGAVMNSDLGTKGQILVGDGSGDPTVLAVGTNNHVLVADSSEATGVKWATVPAGSGMSNLVEDTTPQLGGNLDVQASEINTSTTNGNIKVTPNGTGLFEIKGNTNAGTLQLNCENNSHGVKIKSPPHSAAASYTLTLPNNDGDAGQFLKTDGSGVTSWDSAANLTTLTEHTGADANGNSAGDLIFEGTDTDSSGSVTDDDRTKYDKSLNTFNIGKNVNINIGFLNVSTKTAATTAVQNGLTGYVQQFSAKIGNSTGADIWLSSQGKKVTIASSDSLTHEVARFQTSALGSSQHGFVHLNYVTANAGGNTSMAQRLATTATGMTFTGVVVPAADSTHDLGTNAVRWRNVYADDLYGSAANLTNIPAANITGTLPAIDGSALTGIASTTGGGAIYENSATISASRTIPSGSNGMSAGPVSVANGVTLTVSSGSVYTVV